MRSALRDTAMLTVYVDSYVYCRNYKGTSDLLTNVFMNNIIMT